MFGPNFKRFVDKIKKGHISIKDVSYQKSEFLNGGYYRFLIFVADSNLHLNVRFDASDFLRLWSITDVTIYKGFTIISDRKHTAYLGRVLENQWNKGLKAKVVEALAIETTNKLKEVEEVFKDA